MTIHVPKENPWEPPDFDATDYRAVQALREGVASAEQQKHVCDLVLNKLCAVHDISYRPSGDRDTTFAEGKRFVGLMFGKLLTTNPSIWDRRPNTTIPTQPIHVRRRKHGRTEY